MSWPYQSRTGAHLPGDVARISLEFLRELGREASVMSLSATGRPGWLATVAESVDAIYLHVFSDDSPSTYRCIATVLLSDESSWYFSVDVNKRTFRSVASASRQEIGALPLRVLESARHVPVEADGGNAEP